MESIRNALAGLSPKTKMYAAIGGTVLVVGTLVGYAMNLATPEARTREAVRPSVAAVLTDQDPRALGIDAMAAQLRQMQVEQQRIQRTLGAAEKDRKQVETQEKITSLEEQVKLLHQELGRVGRNAGKDSKSDSTDAVAVKESAKAVIPERNPHFVQKATNSADALGDVYSNLPPPPPIDPRARSSEKVEAPKIRVIRNEKAKAEDQEEKELSVTIPAGSILSGVLVTGMDAPTGKQAQRDPFPSLLRIKSEAILPNRFRADFRECMLIAGGWGDLSSERAYMRAERISCVRNDGTVLEAPIEAYATGEDGKTGLRGRLVSKQGQLIARSLMAGLMEGAASAFDVRQVPSINITRGFQDGGDAQAPVYEQAFDSNALQAAGARGAGSALERIADYYLEMAESIFPVIEIDAMRNVDFIVNKGMTVKFNSTTLKVADVN
ncbi:TrbI/VirB10 family protein [Stutzerimonas stutzeri]|jgi:conjugal transfer pilus assembly protein TraB|uniref:Pilus assembly protein n=1 Tax=Stutzerimonas stutzeri TaxID=316 RepID=A0AA40RVB7_STUST|nr:TrbI/VirB10 family protein [Stutzerimonas stutzeri]MBA1306174.1 pilus assembly protein [Stutzerimonas stutzeri]